MVENCGDCKIKTQTNKCMLRRCEWIEINANCIKCKVEGVTLVCFSNNIESLKASFKDPVVIQLQCIRMNTLLDLFIE